jgi:hypothetical protein
MLYVPVPAVGSTVHGLQTELRNLVNKRPLEIQNASSKCEDPAFIAHLSVRRSERSMDAHLKVRLILVTSSVDLARDSARNYKGLITR